MSIATFLQGVGLVAAGLLLTTWLGYPLLAHAMARLTRRSSVPSRPFTPTVSLVLATRDEPALIDAKIDSILASDYPSEQREIVIAFDSSTYRHVPTLRHLDTAGITLVIGDSPGGKAATLNAAVRRATGAVLVFTDTRQELEPAALREIVRPLLDPSIGAVSGALALDAERRDSPINRYWNFELALRQAEARWHSAVGVSGSFYATRRELWAPLPAGLILDDLFTPMRLVLEGKRVTVCPEAIVRETRQTTPQLEYRRKIRTLAGNVQLCMWLPSVLRPGRNPIWLQFFFHKLMRLATPALVCVVAISMAAAGLSIMGPNLLAAVLSLGLAACAVVLLPPLRVIRAACVWGAYMVSAAGIGLLLGMRRQWDVWH